VKIWQDVASEQPDEPVARVPALQQAHGVDGEASALAPLEVTDPDAASGCDLLSRGETRIERRHIRGALFQGIARRHDPPQLIEV
jgi:hypothetical protein